MQFSQLNVKPGDAVQLDLGPAAEARLSSRLVGYIESKALLLSLPGGDQTSVDWASQAMVEVYVYAPATNAAMFFPSPVLAVTSSPQPLLWLGYPAMVMRDESRKNERVAANIDARILTEAGAKPAKITDLSATGCGLQLAEKLPAETQALKLEVDFPLPKGIKTAKVSAHIKAVSQSVEAEVCQYHYGLAFHRLSEAGTQLLQRCIACIKSS